jgi:hypothetical protein
MEVTVRPLLLAPVVLLTACPGADTGKDADDTNTGPEPVCTDPVAPTCVDEMILDLSLHDDKVSEGEVANTTEDDDFVTTVDASAGGFGQETENAWVYVRFTPDGAERVDIDDETALESMDWDLSLRRFIVRVNSGDSGPSCVGVAPMFGVDYFDVSSVPEEVSWIQDDYYTKDCTLVNDSSGLEGSPQVALGAWWSYASCLQMTYTPFLLQQMDGSVLKLRVETYYDEGQDVCDETGQVAGSGGYFTLRWRYL